jgi:hypothetical protein
VRPNTSVALIEWRSERTVGIANRMATPPNY